MEAVMEKIKRVHWFRAFEKDIVNNEMHSVFHLGTDMLTKVSPMEPIQITIGNPNEIPQYFGIAVVSSVKVCCIAELDPQDLSRQKPGFRSKRDTINTLRKLHPNEEVNMSTEVTVITLRRCDYSLKRLNASMKNRVVKKV